MAKRFAAIRAPESDDDRVVTRLFARALPRIYDGESGTKRKGREREKVGRHADVFAAA